MKKIIIVLFVQLCITICLQSTSSVRAQWVQTNLSYNGAIRCLTLIGSNLFAGSFGGVYLTSNNGANWAAVNTGLTDTSVLTLAVNGSNIFAGTGGGVYFSTNNGTNWEKRNTGFPDFFVVDALTFSGTNLFAGIHNPGSSGTVFLSTENGLNWTSKSTGLESITTISTLAVMGVNLFAGSDLKITNYVFFSSDQGGSWSNVSTGLTGSSIYALAVIGTNLFVGTEKGVSLTTNNGTSWTLVNTGLAYPYISGFAVSGLNLFVATGDGSVSLTTNNGTSWVQVNTGFAKNTFVNRLEASSTFLYAGTLNTGVWRRPLSEMISVNSTSKETASTFSIEQNSPNPFNASTMIHYSIPIHEHVRIILSNILGEKLASLLDEDIDAGAHDLTISANDLPGGVYVVMVTAGGMSKSEKISVQK